MKTILIIFVLFVFEISSLMGNDIDMLKPDTFRKVKELRQLFDTAKENGVDYEIKIIKHEFGLKYSSSIFPSGVLYSYQVKLQPKIEKILNQYKAEKIIKKEIYEGQMYEDEITKISLSQFTFISQYLPRYMDDDLYSFYAYIFLLYLGDFSLPPELIEPILKNSPHDWNVFRKNNKQIIDVLRKPHYYPNNSHDRFLFISTLPKKFFWDLYYWGRDKKIENHKEKEELSEENEIVINFYSTLVSPTIALLENAYNSKIYTKYQDAILSYLQNSPQSIDQLATITGKEIDDTCIGLYLWIIKCLSDDNFESEGSIKAFFAWLRLKQKMPIYTAITMSLFIVKGYEFDESVGDYNPNELGKIMLDYIVENPIPENAERLKIIRDGGNENLISELMKKHKTKEKWDELFSQKANSDSKK